MSNGTSNRGVTFKGALGIVHRSVSRLIFGGYITQLREPLA